MQCRSVERAGNLGKLSPKETREKEGMNPPRIEPGGGRGGERGKEAFNSP